MSWGCTIIHHVITCRTQPQPPPILPPVLCHWLWRVLHW